MGFEHKVNYKLTTYFEFELHIKIIDEFIFHN